MQKEVQFLNITIQRFKYYKSLGDKTIEQLNDDNINTKLSEESNSVVQIVQHISGNMKSRWTDFLTSDGEKDWRNRDSEFEIKTRKKKEVIEIWESGWAVLLTTLEGLSEEDLGKNIFIRGEGQSVLSAIQRQLGHYAGHVGQLMFLAKLLKGKEWQSLSIPLGQSEIYNVKKFAEAKPKILVATDFSPSSVNALNFAEEFAKDIDASVLVVHVIFPHLNPGNLVGQSGTDELVKNAELNLTKFIKKHSSSDHKLEAVVEVGFVVDQIIEMAEERKVDYIIGSNSGHGHGLVNNFGTTASQIALKAKTKVLLIPADAKYQHPKLMVLANNHNFSNEDMIKSVVDFALSFKSELQLLHLDEEKGESKNVAEEIISALALPLTIGYSILKPENTLKTINDFANQVNADWLLMIPRERSFWRSFLGKTINNEVMGCTDRPLLIYR